ncbi:MAG: Lrp/AsnC family transcriptional regulator [Thermodesulfobacteriota bacterium]
MDIAGNTTREPLDSQDRRLAVLLAEDGTMAAGEAAERLGVSAPTVRSRLKGLLARGAMRIAALVDPARVKDLTIALVAVSLQSHQQLDEKLEAISRLDKVSWAAVVTGRYDIMVEVVLSDDIADLYRFLNEDLGKVGGINASESFVVMKAKRKWTLLPAGARERFAG